MKNIVTSQASSQNKVPAGNNRKIGKTNDEAAIMIISFTLDNLADTINLPLIILLKEKLL